MKRICDKCGGSGTLPEVIMVRIKAVKPFIYFYRPILGQVYSVTKAGDTYIDIENPLCKFKITGTEQIPDIPEGYRLRRKWGKDEEKIGLRDMFPTEDGWQLTFRQSGSKQESEIYITPIKPATPDPSADCLDDTPEPYRAKKHRTFIEDLTSLLNIQSEENGSNTPDFILAQYLEGCLRIYESAVQQRETWHGRDPRPSHTRYGVEMAKQNTEINPESPEGGE